jgi:hypothetical protein
MGWSVRDSTSLVGERLKACFPPLRCWGARKPLMQVPDADCFVITRRQARNKNVIELLQRMVFARHVAVRRMKIQGKLNDVFVLDRSLLCRLLVPNPSA